MRHLPLAIAAAMLLAGFAAADRTALAQESSSISGRVVDVRTHQPIGGAKVEVQADGATLRSPKAFGAALSRKDGGFHVDGLRAGRYQIVLTKVGYSIQLLTGLSVRAGERTIVGEPIAMHPASVDDMQKMACNSIVQPGQSADVYVVCGSTR